MSTYYFRADIFSSRSKRENGYETAINRNVSWRNASTRSLVVLGDGRHKSIIRGKFLKMFVLNDLNKILPVFGHYPIVVMPLCWIKWKYVYSLHLMKCVLPIVQPSIDLTSDLIIRTIRLFKLLQVPIVSVIRLSTVFQFFVLRARKHTKVLSRYQVLRNRKDPNVLPREIELSKNKCPRDPRPYLLALENKLETVL